MKKFLAVLLIAIVACEAAEEISLKNIIDTIVDYLKKFGIYDALVSKGKEYAIKFCANYLDEGLCTMGINYLCDLLHIN